MGQQEPIAAVAGFAAACYWLARWTRRRKGSGASNARELTSLASFRLHQVLNGGFGGDFVALLGSFPWQKDGEQSVVVVRSANPVPQCSDDVLRVQLELQVESGAGIRMISAVCCACCDQPPRECCYTWSG